MTNNSLNGNMTFPIKKPIGQLSLEVHANRVAAGQAAGMAVADALRNALAQKGTARIIFAAAPSQNETLETLVAAPGIDWKKVTAFHMDEYIGLDDHAPQRFSHYLQTRVFDKLPLGEVNLMVCGDPQSICATYAKKLQESPIDVVCMGVGENGHIAFNDPPVADFNDPEWVKVVELDLACRQQQVNDGCFPNLEAVPNQAVTLTIPALLAGEHLICTILGERKRAAVHRMISDDISTEHPATILRTKKSCTVYIDQDCWGPASV